jgi:hypothetical protein
MWASKVKTVDEQKKYLVVICGDSAGHGGSFRGRRYRIGLLALDESPLATTREFEQYGGQVRAISLDVAEASAVQAAAIELEEQLGPLVIWINSANGHSLLTDRKSHHAGNTQVTEGQVSRCCPRNSDHQDNCRHLPVQGLLDRILSRQGYSGQTSSEGDDGKRGDNLREPQTREHQTRGRLWAAHGIRRWH